MRSDTASGTSSSGGRRRATPGLAARTGPCPQPPPRAVSGRSFVRQAPRIAAVAGSLAAVAILATCEAATGPRSGHIVLAYIGDTTLTAGVRTAASVLVTVDGSPYTSPHLTLRSSDSTVLAVATTASGTDTLVARGLGSATLTTQLVNSALSGPPPKLTTTFFVSPKSVQFDRGSQPLGAFGDTVTVPVHAFDIHNEEIPNVVFIWTSSDTLFAKVSNKGRLTAMANGSTTVKASVAGDTAALAVTVQQVPAHFAFTPSLPVTLTAFGADTILAAGAVDSLGNAIKGIGALPTWGLQSTGVITVD